MIKPLALDSFEYEGRTIGVEWFEVDNVAALPDVSWQQVYAVAELNGLVALVVDVDGKINLPGGKTEPGESIEDTLRRELREEMNCKVVKWSVIGYQRLSDGMGGPIYQLRVYAKLEEAGEFKVDPAGDVVGHEFVALKNLNQAIGYGKVGERMSEAVKKYFK